MAGENESPFGYVQDGVSDVANGAQFGMAHFANDMARLGSAIQPIVYSPQAQAAYQHHGMVMYEMGTMGALGAATGLSDAPRYMSQAEFQQAGIETLSQNVAGAAVYGGIAAASGFGLAGAGMMIPMTRWGRQAAQAGARAMGGGAMAGGTGIARWIRPTARAGSLAARAGALTYSMGMGTTAGISMASGLGGIAMAGGALMASMAPIMLADAAVSKVVDVARERSEIADYIQASSFRYAPPSQWTDSDLFGGGYGRKAAGQIAEGIMRYEAQNQQYDLGELKGILQKGTQIGLFSSTRDATDFQNKFKETADALKTITKVMHTTLSEGMDTIKALKDVGVTGTAAQAAMVNRSDIIGLASGKTASEMFTIGLQGAQMLRGTGINMGAGVEANQAMYAQLVNMQRQGTITSEQVAQMGGLEAFSQSMVAGAIRSAQTPMGRAMMMATTTDGVFDPAKLAAIASGKMSYQEALFNASKAAQDPMNFMNMQVNQEKNIAAMMRSFGGTGAQIAQLSQSLMMSQEYLRTSGQEATQENQERAMRFFLRRSGNDAASTDAMMGLLKDQGELQRNLEAATRQSNQKRVIDSYTERYGIGNQFTREWREMNEATFGRAGRYIGRTIDDWTTGITGWYNKNVLGMTTQGHVDYNMITEPSLAGGDFKLSDLKAIGGTGDFLQQSASRGSDLKPISTIAGKAALGTGLGVGIAIGAAALGTVVTGGLMAPVAAGLIMGAAAGTLDVGAQAVGSRNFTIGQSALASGAFSKADLVPAETPGASPIGNGQFVKKEAIEREVQRFKGVVNVNADDIVGNVPLSTAQTKALLASKSRTISDAERAQIVMAGGDLSLLNDEKRAEYDKMMAKYNVGPLTAQQQASMEKDKQAFFGGLSLTGFSLDKGQKIYAQTFGLRGERAQGEELIRTAGGFAGANIKNLGVEQDKLKEIQTEYKDILVKEVVIAAMGVTSEVKDSLTDAMKNDPEMLEIVRNLNSEDEQVRVGAKGKLLGKVTKASNGNLGSAAQSELMDKLESRLTGSGGKDKMFAGITKQVNAQTNKVRGLQYASLSVNAEANIKDVADKLKIGDDKKLAITNALTRQSNAFVGGTMSDEDATNLAIENAKTVTQTLSDTGMADKLPVLARSQLLLSKLNDLDEKGKAELSKELGIDTSKMSKSDIAQRLIIGGKKEAEVTAKGAKDEAAANLAGVTDIAEALTVIHQQTKAIQELISALTGMTNNIKNEAARAPLGLFARR